jgi:hypothetical protein
MGEGHPKVNGHGPGAPAPIPDNSVGGVMGRLLDSVMTSMMTIILFACERADQRHDEHDAAT